MPIDERELKRARRAPSEVISEDRLCDRCRYNLRGLPARGRCPECGFPIRRRRRSARFVDNLVDAPVFYLKTLALGLGLMAAASCIFIVASIASAFASAAADLRLAVTNGLAALVWWIGVYIVTAQRPLGEHTVRDAVLESAALRKVNRIIQAAWLLGALLAFLQVRTGAAAVGYAAGAALITASFGLVPLAVHMSSLADWAGDTGISERFKVAAWAMAFFGVPYHLAALWLPVAGAIGIFAGMVAFWCGLFEAIAQGAFLISLFQLAAAAVWAIRNAVTASDAARRIADRREDPTAHLVCSHCGYSLQGLPPLSPCPECGRFEESVRQSGLVSLATVRRQAETAMDLSPIPLAPRPEPNRPGAPKTKPASPSSPGSANHPSPNRSKGRGNT